MKEHTMNESINLSRGENKSHHCCSKHNVKGVEQRRKSKYSLLAQGQTSWHALNSQLEAPGGQWQGLGLERPAAMPVPLRSTKQGKNSEKTTSCRERNA